MRKGEGSSKISQKFARIGLFSFLLWGLFIKDVINFCEIFELPSPFLITFIKSPFLIIRLHWKTAKDYSLWLAL